MGGRHSLGEKLGAVASGHQSAQGELPFGLTGHRRHRIFQIAGELEGGVAVVHLEGERLCGVVGLHYRHLGVPQGKYRTGLRDGGGEALGLGIAPEIRKYRAAGILHRGEYLPHGAGVKGAGKAAHMGLIRRRTHHIVEVGDPLLAQVTGHLAAPLGAAAVNEHGLSAAQEQGGAGLPRVDEVDGQSGAVSGGCALAAGQGGGQEKDGEDRECALFHKGSFKMR